MEERQKRSIAYRVGDTPRDRPSIHFKAGTGGIAFCLRCHGESKSSAGLRIDSREALVLGGELGVAIVPGRPDESLLMRAIARHESVSALPPEKEQALRPEQVAIEGRVHVHDLHATILHSLRSWLRQKPVISLRSWLRQKPVISLRSWLRQKPGRGQSMF